MTEALVCYHGDVPSSVNVTCQFCARMLRERAYLRCKISADRAKEGAPYSLITTFANFADPPDNEWET